MKMGILVLISVAIMSRSFATASWGNSEPHGETRCGPCQSAHGSTRDEQPSYRGNGADNIGYDWSPKAWGGPAFPQKKSAGDYWDERRGRMMPDGKHFNCNDCSTNRQIPGRSSESDMVATVTSPVLGIRLRDDKRLPVDWPGRSMRWDGFRNGMPWNRLESKDTSERVWDERGRDLPGLNREASHYAADWTYGSAAANKFKWDAPSARPPPWTAQWHRDTVYDKDVNDRDRSYSNYNPASPPTRPSYSNNRWPSAEPGQYHSESPNPSGGQNPQNQYPRPTTQQYPPRPEIYVHRPNQNYLPSGPSTPTPPQYADYPYKATSGTAIWNGRPNIENRPGFYTGYITELHDYNNKYAPGGEYTQNQSPARPDPHGQGGFPANYINHSDNKYGSNDRYNYYATSSNSPNNISPTYGNYPSYNQNPYRPNENNPNFGHNVYPHDWDKSPNIPDRYKNGYGDNKVNSWNNNNNYGYPENNFNQPNKRPNYPGRPNNEHHGHPNLNPNGDSSDWNYGEKNKDIPYKRSGGSYPPYKGGNYYTSSYLASATTPADGDPVDKTDTTETP